MIEAFPESTINIYRGERGTAALITSEGTQILMVSGGAFPRGMATEADCFVQARIKLARKPNYYRGDLSPVRNGIMNLDEDQVYGRSLGAYIYPKKLKIDGVKTEGICADHIDFYGVYNELAATGNAYKSVFMYFLKLADEDAMYLKEGGDKVVVKNKLKPFVENYHREWNLDLMDEQLIKKVTDDYENLIHH